MSKEDKTDDELKRIIIESRPNIKIIGIGGAGCKVVSRLMEAGIEGAETIVINTDAQALLNAKAHHKILIGKSITRGLGTGSILELGDSAAREDAPIIRDTVKGVDLAFITCGLGGGTGTGSTPVIAEITKNSGALTILMITLPLKSEGPSRMRNAHIGLNRLKNIVDSVIVIPNQKLLELTSSSTSASAYKLADEILVTTLKGIVELITKPGLVNLDFADFKTIIGGKNIGMIGIGEGEGPNRAIIAASEALNSPLLEIDINGAKGALINIVGGYDLKMEETGRIVNEVSKKLSKGAHIIWGAQLDPEFGDKVRVTIVVSGLKLSTPTMSVRFNDKRLREILGKNNF